MPKRFFIYKESLSLGINKNYSPTLAQLFTSVSLLRIYKENQITCLY